MSYLPTTESIKNAFVNAIDTVTNVYYPAIRDTTTEWLGRAVFWIKKTAVETANQYPLPTVGVVNFGIGFTVPVVVDKIWNLFTDLPKQNEPQKLAIKRAVVFGSAALALIAANVALLSALGISITTLPVAAVVGLGTVSGLAASWMVVKKIDQQKLKAEALKKREEKAKARQIEREKQEKIQEHNLHLDTVISGITGQNGVVVLNADQLRHVFDAVFPTSTSAATISVLNDKLAEVQTEIAKGAQVLHLTQIRDAAQGEVDEARRLAGEAKVALAQPFAAWQAAQNQLRALESRAIVLNAEIPNLQNDSVAAQTSLTQLTDALAAAQADLNNAGENPAQNLQDALNHAQEAVVVPQGEVNRIQQLIVQHQQELNGLLQQIAPQKIAVDTLARPLAALNTANTRLKNANVALINAERELAAAQPGAL